MTTIADAEGFGFKQLRNFTLDHARNATSFIQDSFPLWFRSVHVINAPRLFYLVSVLEFINSSVLVLRLLMPFAQAFNVVKPFLNERIKKSIYFHNSIESLHEQVPKEILPKELGGDLGPFDNNACANAVFGIEPHFYRVQAMVAANKGLLTDS